MIPKNLAFLVCDENITVMRLLNEFFGVMMKGKEIVEHLGFQR